MRMTKSEAVYLLLGVLCIIQFTNAAPVSEIRDGSNIVDEIIMKLKQLRQQNEGHSLPDLQSHNSGYSDEITRVHRLDNLGGGYLLKRSSDLDSLGGGYLLKRSTNLDSLGGGYLLKRSGTTGALDSLGGGYLLGRLALAKKGLDPDHRALLYNFYNHPYGVHLLDSPKRNFDEIDRLSDFEKRNFDEIDRMGSLYDFKKRNFDEIDRMGALTDF